MDGCAYCPFSELELSPDSLDLASELISTLSSVLEEVDELDGWAGVCAFVDSVVCGYREFPPATGLITNYLGLYLSYRQDLTFLLPQATCGWSKMDLTCSTACARSPYRSANFGILSSHARNASIWTCHDCSASSIFPFWRQLFFRGLRWMLPEEADVSRVWF